MINLYISNLLVVIIFLSYGSFINFILFKENQINRAKIFNILCGIVYLSFIAILINFFSPLNHFINNLIFTVGILFFIFYIKKDIDFRNTIKLICIISAISFLIMTLDNSNRPDAGLYHLPYISILNDNKTIFGLANIHFRFAHTSIIQHTSAIFNNSLFSTKGITIPISVIVSTVLIYFFKKFNTTHKNYFFLISYFLITFFITIKVSRYNDIGNDSIGHLFFFVIIIIFINFFYENKFQYKDFFFLSLFCIFAFTNKAFFVFSFIFPIIFILYSKKYFFLIKKKTFLLFFLLFLFLLKNVTASSCLIYPIKMTCFKSLSWSSMEYQNHANPEMKAIEGKAAVKAWSNFKEKDLSYEEYNADFRWLETWMGSHFKYIMNKLIPLMVIILVLIILLISKEKFKDKTRIPLKINTLKLPLTFTTLLCLFASIYWFLNFPLYRYGYSFFISIIILIVSYLIYSCFEEKNKQQIFKILKIILIISITLIAIKNILRIYSKYKIPYNEYPWPKIYSYNNKNIEQQNYKINISTYFSIYHPQHRLCMYSKGPCTHYTEISEQIDVKKILGYIVVMPKNKF